jgi:hypothetical protein
VVGEDTWGHVNAEKWAAQKKAAARARYRAEQQLIQRHLDEFNRLHQDCGLEEGVEVKPTPPKWIRTPRPPRSADRLVRPRMRLAAVPEPETAETLTEHINRLRMRLYKREYRARKRGERSG